MTSLCEPAVKLDQLITFFSTSPSAKLLRSPNSAYIIHFLHRHFKADGNLALLHSVLLQHLSLYLDELHEQEPDVLPQSPDAYLNAWSAGDTRWLRRYFDAEHSESVYELTLHTELVLTFLTQILERSLNFVGTESRLSRIIATLSDIVIRGSADPERRLDFLRAEQRKIEQEIRSIEAGNAVETHSPTAIRERFADAISDLISLQGDFRAVEESFKRITRDVQKRQAEAIDSRGNILGFALEAEDHLRDQDQGASFHAFVRLILSQPQQDSLEKMISQLDEIADLAEQIEGKRRAKSMIGSLSAEAEKVLRVTRRLNSTLRRLLDSRASNTRLRLAELLCEIRALAARDADSPQAVGIDVYSELELLNVHQRTFWEAPVRFSEVELSHDEPSDDDRVLAFRRLAEMQRLDWDAMQDNIKSALQCADQTSLPELLRRHPATAGAIEVLGYVKLAFDDGHLIDECQTDVVQVTPPDDAGHPRRYEIPRVVFLSDRIRQPPDAEGDPGND